MQCYLPDMTWPLHPWTHNSCIYLHKSTSLVKTQQATLISFSGLQSVCGREWGGREDMKGAKGCAGNAWGSSRWWRDWGWILLRYVVYIYNRYCQIDSKYSITGWKEGSSVKRSLLPLHRTPANTWWLSTDCNPDLGDQIQFSDIRSHQAHIGHHTHMHTKQSYTQKRQMYKSKIFEDNIYLLLLYFMVSWKWNQTRCSPIDWIMKFWYMYKMEYYSAERKKEIWGEMGGLGKYNVKG